ncbi:unnamed protein product [Merluccius merluccius]
MPLWRLFVSQPPLTDICTSLFCPPISSLIQRDKGRADARPLPQHLSIMPGSAGLDMETMPQGSRSQGHGKNGVLLGYWEDGGEWVDGGRYRADIQHHHHPRESCVHVPSPLEHIPRAQEDRLEG